MGIHAIETSYAGCRFRSRLEARWAVFFDQLNIGWQYEPQGFEMPEGTRYLPDFWLRDNRIYVEVKGSGDAFDADMDKLRSFVQNLHSQDGRDHCVVVLGEVPTAQVTGDLPMHLAVHIDEGEPVVRAALVMCDNQGYRWRFIPVYAYAEITTQPRYIISAHPASRLARAYQSARSARFEHGEQGAPATVPAARRSDSAELAEVMDRLFPSSSRGGNR
jgi:hypothetical protein